VVFGSKFDIDRQSKYFSYSNCENHNVWKQHTFLTKPLINNFYFFTDTLQMIRLTSLIQMKKHPIIPTMVNNILSFYTIWVIKILNDNNTNKPSKISQIEFDIIYLFSFEFNLAIT